MKLQWEAISQIADNTPRMLVSLSPESVTLANAAYSFLYNMGYWDIDWEDSPFGEVDEIKAAVDRLMRELSVSMMIGTLMPYVGLTVPIGTLRCDAAIYQRVDYPELYEYLSGTAVIIDADSFHTPLFTGRTIVAAGSGFPHGSAFGEASVTLTVPQIPAHDHVYTPAVLNVDLESPGAPDVFAAGVGVPTATSQTGGGQPHNNYQPSLALNYCIVAGR